MRVPVRYAHGEAVWVELERGLEPAEAAALYRRQAGVVFVEGRHEGERRSIPTPRTIAGRREVFVSRVRRDDSVPHGLALWVVADNLYKGAATNAVQIAEALLPRLSS